MFHATPFSESNIESRDWKMILGDQLLELCERPRVRFNCENAPCRAHSGCGEGGVIADICANVDYGHAMGEKSVNKASRKPFISTEIDRALDPIGQVQFELQTKTPCTPHPLVRGEKIQQTIFPPEVKWANKSYCSVNHDAGAAALV